MRPMLAIPSARPGVPPAGPGWQHEVKWDGVRILADRQAGRLTLTNRNEIEVTIAYPELTLGIDALPDDVLIDGEVVVLEAGQPSFNQIAARMHVRDANLAAQKASSSPVTYMIFDILRLAGHDLTKMALSKRRAVLAELELPTCWQLPQIHEDGAALAAATAEMGLEGVVSKRLDSPYRPGARSPDWVKVPHRHELVAVIGGWVPEKENPNRLGSVWVGYPTDEASFEQSGVLYPIARAGSGLLLEQREGLLEVLRSIERPDCPFDPYPDAAEARRSHWVEPIICVQVRYLNWADSGVLRQPVLRALRPDITALQAPTAELINIEG